MLQLNNNSKSKRTNQAGESEGLDIDIAMKFHHLARHNTNQFIAAAVAAATASAAANQDQGQSSPLESYQLHAQTLKTQLGQQQYQTMKQTESEVSKRNQHQQMNSDEEDEEDEDFNESQSLYDPLRSASNTQHLKLVRQTNKMASQQLDDESADKHHLQLQHHNQQQQQPVDTASFLVDKNKKLFPQKLWELIHNPSIQHCLRWSQDGQRVYLNRNEFEAYYLKTPNNQFHTQKAISFVRQMNMYGFRKVDDYYYENDNFRRDSQHLLRNMIRRHPNKGLFVGLDQHQMAVTAAAAQQAHQVNQQLQHLESQHKQRTEQALRLSSYLNGNHHHNHQFQQQNHHHHQQQAPLNLDNHHHSDALEQMSSQLAQAAANHLSKQHHHQLQQRAHLIQQQLANRGLGQIQFGQSPVDPQRAAEMAAQFQASSIQLIAAQKPSGGISVGTGNETRSSSSNENGCSNDAVMGRQHTSHCQDSVYSNSSQDTNRSQSSIVDSGSDSSPQPNLSAARNLSTQGEESSAAALRAAVLAAASQDTQLQQALSKFAAFSGANKLIMGSQATNLSTGSSPSSAIAQQQALHHTLVRSLLQLKGQGQHQHHDLLAASLHQGPYPGHQFGYSNQQEINQHLIQQNEQNQRSLLKSLASLSSTGTGSILDPTSNSPTERTASPPSSPPSPLPAIDDDDDAIPFQEAEQEEAEEEFKVSSRELCNNSTALDLAKSTAIQNRTEATSKQLDETEDTDIDDEETPEIEQTDSLVGGHLEGAGSPLDGHRKVRRFLDTLDSSEQGEDYSFTQAKKMKLRDDGLERPSVDSISMLLVQRICDRYGESLELDAIQDAARYTERFIDLLVTSASSVSRNESQANQITKTIEKELTNEAPNDESDESGNVGLVCKQGDVDGTPVDASSLALALELIPSRLLAAIQDQQVTKKLDEERKAQAIPNDNN